MFYKIFSLCILNKNIINKIYLLLAKYQECLSFFTFLCLESFKYTYIL